MTAGTRGSSGRAPLVTLKEMKQAKSILVRHRTEVERSKKTTNQENNQQKNKPNQNKKKLTKNPKNQTKQKKRL